MPDILSNSALCRHYDIAVYPVESLNDNPSPEEAGKYFVSTLATDFGNHAATIPLAESEVVAEALAVAHLNLRQLYRLEQTHGPQPRLVLPD